MRFIETEIQGLFIVEPEIHGDSRGYFVETYNQLDFDRELAAHGLPPVRFVQDNESMSVHGVLRGLHFQTGEQVQAKLVRVTEGEILDVAVDLREGSPTYLKHVAVRLSADNHRQFFLPKGFAHGFVVLSEKAVFHYKCDEFYCPESEGGIRWNREDLGIDWILPEEELILSEKDRNRRD